MTIGRSGKGSGYKKDTGTHLGTQGTAGTLGALATQEAGTAATQVAGSTCCRYTISDYLAGGERSRIPAIKLIGRRRVVARL